MPAGPADLTDVALAVLAGGEGRRMGYPKGEMCLGGRPVLRVLLERFSWPGPTLLVTASGRERPTGWELFTREVADPAAGQGPLRGLLTALENCPAPSLVAVPVDMPALRREHLEWVAAVLRDRPRAAGAILQTREGNLQPFPSAFRSSAAAMIRERLESGVRAMRRLADDPAVVMIDAPAEWSADTWTNVNTPDDLAAFNGRATAGADARMPT